MASPKTYIPQLVFLASITVKYMKRWQNKLQGTLDTQQYLCLVATIEALDQCLQLIQPPPPVN